MDQKTRIEKAKKLITDMKASGLKIEDVSKVLCRAYSIVRADLGSKPAATPAAKKETSKKKA